MAESLRGKVEEHLTCSICLEPFKDPKVLPCLHSYCHGCIVNLTKNAETNTINCPECRLVVEVDENAVCTLPSNFFVNNLLATMALTDDKPTAKKICCDSCDSEDAAKSRCNDCGIFLCQYCTEFHKRSRSMKHHELMTMDELKSNPGPQSIAEKIRCPKHKDEIIKLFCKTCQTTICRDCTIVDHQGHKYGFVEEVAVEEKGKINVSLNEVKERKVRVVEGIEILKRFNMSLEAKKESTVAKVRQHFNELLEATESRRNEMEAKATALTNAKQKQIQAQVEVLEMALASCDSSIEFTEQAFTNGNDVQILSMEKYILQSMEQLKAVKDQTKPCVSADMVFFIPSSVEETKEKLLNHYDVGVAVVNPDNCQAAFESKEVKFNSGNTYFVTLICNDKENRRLRRGGQDIKPLFTGMEVSNVVVTDNEDGSYTIRFCPRQGGMLKFEVSINGTPVPNCSLTKQVKWVISDAYGRGAVTDGGRTMKGTVTPVVVLGKKGRSAPKRQVPDYCWRVGGCYFETGVHSWKVQFHNSGAGYTTNSEFGIIDYDEINAEVIPLSKKWVLQHPLEYGYAHDFISLTLDMEKRSLEVTVNTGEGDSWVQNYQFTARRVSPFFACNSPCLSITLVE